DQAVFDASRRGAVDLDSPDDKRLVVQDLRILDEHGRRSHAYRAIGGFADVTTEYVADEARARSGDVQRTSPASKCLVELEIGCLDCHGRSVVLRLYRAAAGDSGVVREGRILDGKRRIL